MKGETPQHPIPFCFFPCALRNELTYLKGQGERITTLKKESGVNSELLLPNINMITE